MSEDNQNAFVERRKPGEHEVTHEKITTKFKKVRNLTIINFLIGLVVASFFSYFVFKWNSPAFEDIENFNKRISRSYGLLEQTKRTTLLESKIKSVIRGTTQRKKLEGISSSVIKSDETIRVIADELYVGEYVYGIPADLMIALFSAESYWNHRAVNQKSGASGLGQQMPGTFKFINEHKLDIYTRPDIRNVRANVRASVRTWYWVARRLEDSLGRMPNTKEICWGYDAGPENVIDYFIPNPDTLWEEPKEHGEKVIWYIEQYKNGNYRALWDIDVKRKEYLEEKAKEATKMLDEKKENEKEATVAKAGS